MLVRDRISGEAVRVARVLRGLSQVELARRTGLTLQRLGAIERDRSPLRAEEAAVIFGVLTSEDPPGVRGVRP